MKNHPKASENEDAKKTQNSETLDNIGFAGLKRIESKILDAQTSTFLLFY